MRPDLERGFRLGLFKIEPLKGSISGPQDPPRHIEPKVMEVLVLLATHASEVVTRRQLIEAVWQRHVSADQLLNRAVSELRRALRDQRHNPAYIETIPKRGYRLLAEVLPIDEPAGAPANEVPAEPASWLRYRVALVALAALAMTSVLAWLLYSGFVSVPPEKAGPTPRQPVALDDWSAGATSVAVLPFVNMSDEPGNDYLADGLSEEIRNLLAQIPDLKVIGRTSSSVFKDHHEDLRSIGQQLGVKALIEGSVRTSGDRIRIAAQLIDVEDASQIWSNTYDRNMTDLFEIQDDVATAVIDALQLHITRYPSRGRPTESATAYGRFLTARIALSIQDPETAERDLLDAVTIDPGFAEAFELLAHVYWTTDEPTLMRDTAAKALAITPDLPFARALYIDGDTANYSLADVLDAHLRAARARPNDPAILRTLSWNLTVTGYPGEALPVAERLAEIDPLSQIAHIRRAAIRQAVGRKREASASLEIAHQLTGILELDWYLGETYLSRNEDEEAIGHFETAVRSFGESDLAWVRRIVTEGRNSDTGQAFLDQEIPRLLQSLPEEIAERLPLKQLYLFLGHMDRYFEIILDEDPSMYSPASYYVWMGIINRDLGFTAHPQYLEVARRMGFVDLWEHRGPPDFCEKKDGGWACH